MPSYPARFSSRRVGYPTPDVTDSGDIDPDRRRDGHRWSPCDLVAGTSWTADLFSPRFQCVVSPICDNRVSHRAGGPCYPCSLGANSHGELGGLPASPRMSSKNSSPLANKILADAGAIRLSDTVSHLEGYLPSTGPRLGPWEVVRPSSTVSVAGRPGRGRGAAGGIAAPSDFWA